MRYLQSARVSRVRKCAIVVGGWAGTASAGQTGPLAKMFELKTGDLQGSAG